MDLNALLKQYDSKLQKVSFVFSRKSRYIIEKEEFYQSFALRLIELANRYPNLPDQEFNKVLNFSLHNVAVDVLKARFRYVAVDFNDAKNQSLIKETVEPSFLYFYKEATLRMIRDVKAREIFDWLVSHPELVDQVRDARNLVSIRTRRIALRDVIDAVSKQFELAPCAVRYYVRVIKESLVSVVRTEFGFTC